MIIEKPNCNFAVVKNHDFRKKSQWLCRSCGYKCLSMKQPKCPCSDIEVANLVDKEPA